MEDLNKNGNEKIVFADDQRTDQKNLMPVEN